MPDSLPKKGRRNRPSLIDPDYRSSYSSGMGPDSRRGGIVFTDRRRALGKESNLEEVNIGSSAKVGRQGWGETSTDNALRRRED